jgi:hypothetical protein
MATGLTSALDGHSCVGPAAMDADCELLWPTTYLDCIGAGGRSFQYCMCKEQYVRRDASIPYLFSVSCCANKQGDFYQTGGYKVNNRLGFFYFTRYCYGTGSRCRDLFQPSTSTENGT